MKGSIFRFVSALVLGAVAATSFTQRPGASVWQPVDVPAQSAYEKLQWISEYRGFRLDKQAMWQRLAAAPHESSGLTTLFPLELQLPTPEGRLERFRVFESPVLSPELQAKRPWLRTYSAQGLDNRHAVGRLDMGPNGFHALILSPHGDYVIEPIRLGDSETYTVFFRKHNAHPRSDFRCTVVPLLGAAGVRASEADGDSFGRTGSDLRTYRLAMNATGEYTGRFGSVANAENGVVTSVNRVTGVWENDTATRLNIVYIKCWPDPNTDPFSNNSGSTMLGQNQTNLDNTIGDAAYDIGHVFSTGGGGVAGLGVIGVSGQKARGVTGSFNPWGDPFDIDYVAHEMGHQYNMRHTFNGTTSSCGGGNRDSSSAYEPGSGSTIMAYAGICGSENLQSNSDPYFHTASYSQMLSIRGNNARGGTLTSTGNGIPSVTTSTGFTIPRSTPFKLTAVGSDPNGDPLTYCWEQFNLGTASPTSDNTTRPLFRSWIPSTSPTRFFPRLTDLLSGASTPWEILPNVNRTMNFRVTVRDNRAGGGGSDFASMSMTVSGDPFFVTFPTGGANVPAGSVQTVTWNVGGGSASPNVNIYLSTNGGASYGTGAATLLLANAPNNGSAQVVLPPTPTSTARIFVEAASSVFFAVSPNFVMGATATHMAAGNVQGQAGALVDLTGTLTRSFDGQPISGRTVNFSVNGTSVGSATTNASGIATRSYSIPFGTAAGGYPIVATFPGDGSFASSSGSGVLTVGRLVTATVVLEGYGGNITTVPLSLEIRNPGETTPISSLTVFLNSSGQTQFNVPVSGDVDIALKGPHWLRQTLALTGGATSLSFSLVNGDVNDDNRINLTDFSLLSAAFRSRPGDANWNPMADLNGDGVVNLADFSILSANFRRIGDP
jgi:hypothetical protein